jgi:membrane peptidoglycan carboxypeptidase
MLREFERASSLAKILPEPQATIVFDRNGRPAFSFFVEQRVDVPLADVSAHMIDAIVAVEDRRFFSHHGIDPLRIAGAAWRNVLAGHIVEGGSTITQQLARATLLSNVRTLDARCARFCSRAGSRSVTARRRFSRSTSTPCTTERDITE